MKGDRGDSKLKGNERHAKAEVDIHQVAAASQAVKEHHLLMDRDPLVISPKTWYMRQWDLVTMALLFFTAVVTPVEVAFIPTKLNILFWVNRGVDGCFLIDIFLNFFLAVPDPVDGQMIYHHPTIIKRYLKGWFTIDLVSILPFDLVSILFDNDSLSKFKILRVLRLLKLMKLLRILRAGRIFHRLETQFTIDYSSLELAKFAILALTCSHWMACAWGLCADLEDSTQNWLKYTSFNTYVEDGLLTEGQDPRGVVKPLEIYVAALYWSSMTMSTIGYGDIVPSTLIERIFVSICMLVGAFIYGYIIGAVSNVITTRNAKRNRFYQLMSDLNSFLDEGKFAKGLRIRLREYFRYRLASADVDAHTLLLKQMSPALRAEITMSMNTWITKVDFFKQCPEALVIQLTMSIRHQTFPPQEKILVPGDWCDKMYMVRKGVAICRQKILTTGHVFGVECLYKEGKVAYSAHAVTFVDLYWFDRNMLLDALYYFPDMKRYFRILSLKRVFYDEVCAYSKAYRELEAKGAAADLTDKMDERPAHFLRKLRSLYGHDGHGLTVQGAEAQRAKENAAAFIQRKFRGFQARIQVEAKATEWGIEGVFDKQIRKVDPQMYSARAIDVLHHRACISLRELHQKIDWLLTGDCPEPLDGGNRSSEDKVGGGVTSSVSELGSYLKVTRDPDTPVGEKQKSIRPKANTKKRTSTSTAVKFSTPLPRLPQGQGGFAGGFGGVASRFPRVEAHEPSMTAPGSSATDPSGGASTRHAAIAAEAAAAAASRGVEDMRLELRQALTSIRAGAGLGLGGGGGGGGSSFVAPVDADDALGALDRRLSRAITAQEARASQLELLVSDLSTQVGAVTRTLSQMSEGNRMFHERSQRAILANLEQAQARMRDQVSKVLAGVPSGGEGGRSPGKERVVRPGLGSSRSALIESDPPPPRTGAKAGVAWAPGAGAGSSGTLIRRPLQGASAPPPAKPRQGFQ